MQRRFTRSSSPAPPDEAAFVTVHSTDEETEETETESQPTASRVPIKSLQANSKACKDGLRAEQECRNGTHFLEHQLRRAQEVLRGTETQAAICNQTVVSHCNS
nr:PREDICTED: bone marrow stromal antigen 2 [Equus przewalskii]